MKLDSLFAPLLADMRALLKHYKADIATLPQGKTGLLSMYDLLHEVSANRAYDDSHPRWQKIQRVLPYDGRDACFYYVDGANDTHIATLLRRVKQALLTNTDAKNAK